MIFPLVNCNINLETWYEKLKNFTFKTSFLSLSIEDSKSLYNSCNIYYNKNEIFIDDNLKNIIKKIDYIIKNDFNGIAFIKLSTRSPKDSVTSINNEKMKNNFIKKLKNYNPDDKNGHTIAFVEGIYNT
jgi:hypothetical protein